jgi:hypothetical protein
MIRQYFKRKRREKYGYIALQTIIISATGFILGSMALLISFLIIEIASTIVAINNI